MATEKYASGLCSPTKQSIEDRKATRAEKMRRLVKGFTKPHHHKVL